MVDHVNTFDWLRTLSSRSWLCVRVRQTRQKDIRAMGLFKAPPMMIWGSFFSDISWNTHLILINKTTFVDIICVIPFHQANHWTHWLNKSLGFKYRSSLSTALRFKHFKHNIHCTKLHKTLISCTPFSRTSGWETLFYHRQASQHVFLLCAQATYFC